MIDNINLWYAKDKNNEIVKIYNINEENRNGEYYCPICMSKVIPRLGDRLAHHFAHIDASKCTNESFIHFWVKNKLLEIGNEFSVKISDYKILNFKCKAIDFEKEYKTTYGIYKPDITVTTENDEIIYFEIAYTNKKRIDEYYDRWLALDNMVIEVNAKELINGNEEKEFKCVYYQKDIYNFQFKEYRNTSEFKSYQNRIYNSCEIKEAEKRLEKIDWFWQECFKRKSKKISDETFFDSIDCLNIEDRLYVIDKVLKTNCTDVRWLYLYNKQKEIKDFIFEFINNNSNECFVLKELKVCCDKDLVYRELFNKNFQIPYVAICKDKELIFKFYTDYFDKEETLRLLYNFKLINNNAFNDKLNKINKIFNEVYPKYNLKMCPNINNYKYTNIGIYYLENQICEFKIENLDNDDVMKIATYKINDIRKNLKSLSFKEEIEEYFAYKNDIIEGLNTINNHNVELCVNYYRENEIIVRIQYYKSFRETNEYVYLINSDEIRCPKGIYKFSNINEFINISNKLISTKIRNIRYNMEE